MFFSKKKRKQRERTVIDGVVKQKTADTASNLVFKCLTYSGSTLIALTNASNFIGAVGRIGAIFEKTADVDKITFGLNGSANDTIVSADISYLSNGKYFLSAIFLFIIATLTL